MQRRRFVYSLAVVLCAGCTDASNGGFLDGGDTGGDMAVPPGSDLRASLSDMMSSRPPDLTGRPAQDFAMPMTETTSVSVYVEPGAGLTPIDDAINGAASSIDMEMYYMEYGTSVAKALISAAKAGKTVRVMLDPAPMQLSNTSAYNELQSGGVQVKYTSSTSSGGVFTYTHAKAMIVDGKAYWAMTMNLSSSAASSNREYLLVDTDAGDVAEAEEVFNHDWNDTPTQATASRDVISPINARQRIDWIISQASTELDIEWEELSDSDVGYHIQERAKAGAQVKIIVPDNISGTSTQTLLTSLKNVPNIHIKTLGTPQIHGKLVLVDRKAGFIGSQNATSNSLENNREFGAIWSSSSVASKCASAFDSDWSNGTAF